MKTVYETGKIVYKTYIGSKLYGTNSNTSDTDIKGIFIPSLNDVILKQDLDHYSESTGNHHSKNSSDDVDVEYWSIYKFLQLLQKGETGAVDLLFSMFRYDTILFQDEAFTDWFRFNSRSFITKNSKAFVGFCMQQSQRYGIKGTKFNELSKLKSLMLNFELDIDYSKLIFGDFVDLHDQLDDMKYINPTNIEGFDYLQVLGKNYQLSAPYPNVRKSIFAQYDSYGERTKRAAADEFADWKALSHAVRVLDEIKELLETNHLVFPLATADSLKMIKYGEVKMDDVLKLIENKMENLQSLIDTSTLPDKIDQKLIDDTILKFVV